MSKYIMEYNLKNSTFLNEGIQTRLKTRTSNDVEYFTKLSEHLFKNIEEQNTLLRNNKYITDRIREDNEILTNTFYTLMFCVTILIYFLYCLS